MLIEFSIENVMSFNKITTLSMVSTGGRELSDHAISITNSKKSKITVNRLASIFGANASGKSNFLSAFQGMQAIIANSGLRLINTRKKRAKSKLPHYPFLFSSESPNKPSTFQTVFSLADKIYRYGFSSTSDCFTSEWLYILDQAGQKEESIFFRTANEVECGTNNEIKKYVEHLTDSTLFLTILAELKVDLYERVAAFFQNIEFIKAYRIDIPEIIEAIDEDDFHIISEVLRFVDTGLSSVKKKIISNKELNIDEAPEGIKKLFEALKELSDPVETSSFQLLFEHDVYETSHAVFEKFDLPVQQESRGTIVFIGIIAQIISALKNDKILVIDEIDSSLHPLLVEGAIKLFINTKKSKSQLIFTSHCPFIFDQNKMRRDELWITEKNDQGESHLISAAEFKARIDGNLNKQYLEGRFGGIPIVQYKHLERCSQAIDLLIDKKEHKS